MDFDDISEIKLGEINEEYVKKDGLVRLVFYSFWGNKIVAVPEALYNEEVFEKGKIYQGCFKKEPVPETAEYMPLKTHNLVEIRSEGEKKALWNRDN